MPRVLPRSTRCLCGHSLRLHEEDVEHAPCAIATCYCGSFAAPVADPFVPCRSEAFDVEGKEVRQCERGSGHLSVHRSGRLRWGDSYSLDNDEGYRNWMNAPMDPRASDPTLSAEVVREKLAESGIGARSEQVGGDHYAKHKIQPWDIWEEYGLNAFEGAVLKYLLRRKGDRLEDLKKARHTLDRLIEIEEQRGAE